MAKAPLGIVKRDEFEFDAWLRKKYAEAAQRLESLGLNPADVLATEIGWLMCLPKFQSKFLDFDGFQLAFLAEKSDFRIMLKSRQIGFSFAIGCEALARCHIKDRHRAIFVSYNLDDAKSKVEIAKELHDELPLEFQKKIVVDKKTEVGFQSNGSKRTLSTILSMPSKAPRGKTGDVYLDELAHCVNDDAIYQGATALIVRSGGQVTIGSTPMGQRGKFHEIYAGGDDGTKYEDYWRQNVPWWLCSIYCKDVRQAAEHAVFMDTEERVARFGNKRLLKQFNNNSIEDFQQEYECAFQDERVSFYPYETIMPCAHKDRHELMFESVEALASAINDQTGLPKSKVIKGRLVCGYDVGRTGHPSELMIFEERGEGEKYILRYNEQLRDMKFPDQRGRLEKVMRMIHRHVRVFRIDSTGLGRNLAEDLQKNKVWGRKVVLVEFGLKVKTALANSFKILLEEKSIVLVNEKAIVSQIHSIKKKYTASGNEIFDSEKSKKNHADKFWAMALATYRKRKRKKGLGQVTVRVAGEKKAPPRQTKKRAESLPVPKKKQTMIERLFNVPSEDTTEEETIAADLAVLRSTPPEALEAKASKLLTAAKVYKRDGMEEQARDALSRYKRLRRIASQARKAGALT